MNNQELYDRICRVLTWWEHPEECPAEESFVINEMYETLVQVQNEMFNQ